MQVNFFTKNLDILFMMYGLSFVAMGIAIFAQPHRKSIFKLAGIIWLLALFGLLHGIHEWIEMFGMVVINGHKHSSSLLISIRLWLLISSYLFLFEFGRRLVVLRRGQFLPKWLTAAFFFLTVFFIYNTNVNPFIWPRYLLALPGGILSALGFLWYYRDNKNILKLVKERRYFFFASFSVALYAIAGGLVVSQADFFPASVINDSSFLFIFKIPVQVFRALAAVLLSWSVWHILDIFNWETRQRLLDNLTEIRMSKNYLDNIISSIADSLIIVDNERKIRTVNPAMIKLLGYTKEEITGMPLAAIFKENEVFCANLRFKELLAGATIRNYETGCRAKDGNLIPVVISASNVKDDKSEPGGVVIIIKDIIERVKMMQVLETSEKKYRAIIENSNDFIWIIDNNGKFTFLNKRCEEISGYKTEELLGKNFTKFIHSMDVEKAQNIFRNVINGNALQYEMNLCKKDGSLGSLFISSTPMYSGTEIIGAINFGRDITESRKMENKIWEQNAFLMKVLESINHPFSVIDVANYNIKVSNSVNGFWESSKSQLCCYSLYHRDSPCQGENTCPIDAVKKTRLPTKVEHIHYDKNGDPRNFEVNAYPVFDAHGEVVSMIEYCLDVTEKMQSTNELRQLKEYFENLFNCANAPIVVWDSEFKITRFNRAFEQLTGYKTREVIHDKITILLPKEQRESLFKEIFMSQKDYQGSVELPILCKNGNIRTTIWNFANIYSKDGQKIINTIAHGQDITERKRAEESLKEAYNQLTLSKYRLMQVEKMDTIGRLASGVAHEVKNPLAIILQGIEYLSLKIPEDNQDFQMVFSYITEAVMRANNIVKELMNFGKVTELSIEPANINYVIENALFLVKNFIETNRIEIIKNFQSDIPLVNLDKNKIEQALINIIMNSVDSMPGGGQLNIKTYVQEEPIKAVIVEIEDSGTGVPEDILENIFEPFFTTKRGKGGTGLGLAVVKNIVEMHQAEIVLKNRTYTHGVKVILKLKI